MTCKLSAIVAVCEDWGIGCEGDMVVSNRADMRHFVACTKGCPVILGRKTLLSFPGGRPLKNRRNIVLTRDESFAAEGVDVVYSVDEALAAVADEPVAWVIGGGEVYRQFCRIAPRPRSRTTIASMTWIRTFPIWMPIPRGRLRGVAVLPRLPRARVTKVSIMSS